MVTFLLWLGWMNGIGVKAGILRAFLALLLVFLKQGRNYREDKRKERV